MSSTMDVPATTPLAMTALIMPPGLTRLPSAAANDHPGAAPARAVTLLEAECAQPDIAAPAPESGELRPEPPGHLDPFAAVTTLAERRFGHRRRTGSVT